MSGGRARLVRGDHDQIGIVVGPYAEMDYDLPSVMGPHGIMIKVIPPELERESVSWWQPRARRWAEPVAAWAVELETISPSHKGVIGAILRQIEGKLRADKGLRIGSDDNASTWYAVNSALGL